MKGQAGLTVYRPESGAPIADHPAALMSGPWVDKTQNLIGGLFADFLRDAAVGFLIQGDDEISVSLRVDGEIGHLVGVVVQVVEFEIGMG